eukprot:s2841_g8.t1
MEFLACKISAFEIRCGDGGTHIVVEASSRQLQDVSCPGWPRRALRNLWRAADGCRIGIGIGMVVLDRFLDLRACSEGQWLSPCSSEETLKKESLASMCSWMVGQCHREVPRCQRLKGPRQWNHECRISAALKALGRLLKDPPKDFLFAMDLASGLPTAGPRDGWKEQKCRWLPGFPLSSMSSSCTGLESPFANSKQFHEAFIAQVDGRPGAEAFGQVKCSTQSRSHWLHRRSQNSSSKQAKL